MIGDYTDDGGSDFAVVVPVFEMVFLVVGAGAIGCRAVVCDDEFALVVGTEFGAVGQAEIPAQHVDALLAAQPVGFVGDTGHRVDPGDTHRDVGGTELGGRGTETFDEPGLFEVALAPVSDHQGHDPADAGNDGQRHLGDIEPGGRLGGVGRG
ncbi:hypothetical protein ACWIGW_44260 [Nocardia brasiliensis]